MAESNDALQLWSGFGPRYVRRGRGWFGHVWYQVPDVSRTDVAQPRILRT